MKISLTLAWSMAALSQSYAADPSALWNIVHGQCVPDETANSNPAPCALVDVQQHYAILKDIRGATQFLLIPTERVGGIESPEILDPKAPNFWEDAWQARRFVEGRAGRAIPREDLSLAINSQFGRTQNQLHIHIDCVAVDVIKTLAEHQADIIGQWSEFKFPLNGHIYQAMKISAEELKTSNPFQLLADQSAEARSDMGKETLAVIGAKFADGTGGFILLSDRANLPQMNFGSSESLQDHNCEALKQENAEASSH